MSMDSKLPDTKATDGFCPDCISGVIAEGNPTGKEIKLGDIDCYYAAPDDPNGKYPTLVIFTDLFGYKFINSRLIADTYAKGNMHVYIPDILGGDAVPPGTLDFMEEQSKSILSFIHKYIQMGLILPKLYLFLSRHSDAKTIPLLKESMLHIQKLAKEKGNGKVGCIGYCWGGRYSVLAAGGDEPMVDAYAAAHPSRVTIPKDLIAVKCPGIYLLAENDPRFTEKSINEVVKILGSKLETMPLVYIYPGTKHGFAVRGGPSVKEQKDKCLVDSLVYFLEKLK